MPAESYFNNGTSSPRVYPHQRAGLPVSKNGYLYVYVSNETPNLDVFFDNVQVVHTRGPILEETHYYPFGLVMSGISSKAAAFGQPENKYKFNDGTELNSSLDVNLYETDFRLYDAQIGRFVQSDLLAEEFDDWSPYVFGNDNPILLNDPLGLFNDTTGKNPTPHPELDPHITSSGKPRVQGISIINTPGTAIVRNPNYNPFDSDPYKRQQYINFTAWGTHDDRKMSVGEAAATMADILLWVVPASKLYKGVKFLFALRKARQALGLAKLLYASKYGMKSYKALRALNTTAGTQVHHLIEKRFANLLGQNADDMLSIVVTEAEHQAFTNAWRAEIGYNGSKAAITTGTATLNEVQNAARKIYKDYPEILKALGL